MRNDRWSSLAEIRRVLTPVGKTENRQPPNAKNEFISGNKKRSATGGGPILYCRNGERLAYTGEGHLLILGVSSSGKTRRCTIPTVRSFIDAEESFLVVDSKGEIYKHTACYTQGKYRLCVINFLDVLRSERFNLLRLPYDLYQTDKQAAIEMIDDLALSLYPSNERADPFWAQSARSVFTAAVTALLELAKGPEEVNMASVYSLIAKGDERFGTGTYLKTLVDKLPPNSSAAMMLHSYVTTASDTRAGIRSTFMEGISIFARSEGLISMMSGDDLHVSELDGETPTGIYLILPENGIFSDIVGALVNQITSYYIRLAQEKYDGRLPRRMNILIEELGNIGRAINNLPFLLSAARSRGLRIQIVLQALSQLTDIYGQSKATTIISNADILLAFRTNHWDTLAELSRKCGEHEIECEGHISREPIITPSQLAAMETGQALAIISGRTKFITWLPDFTEIYDCSDWVAPQYTAQREIIPPAIFDIQELVKTSLSTQISSGLSGSFGVHKAKLPESPAQSEGLSEMSDEKIAAMMKEIDARIQALDEEEAAKEAAQNKRAGSKEGSGKKEKHKPECALIRPTSSVTQRKGKKPAKDSKPAWLKKIIEDTEEGT